MYHPHKGQHWLSVSSPTADDMQRDGVCHSKKGSPIRNTAKDLSSAEKLVLIAHVIHTEDHITAPLKLILGAVDFYLGFGCVG